MLATNKIITKTTLTPEDHRIAKEFARQQPTREKVKQTYLNTLAVKGGDRYIQWLGYETELETADSWNYGLRLFNNIADLVIPDLGKIEFCPILPNQQQMTISSDSLEERIAYIAVQFQDELTEIKFIGFIDHIDPENPPESINLDDLQPIDQLGDYLDRLQLAKEDEQFEDILETVNLELDPEQMIEMIAKFERLYRLGYPDDWRFDGRDILEEYLPLSSLSTIREKETPKTEEIDLRDIAEQILERLKELWN
jgi:hypothetical protein